MSCVGNEEMCTKVEADFDWKFVHKFLRNPWIIIYDNTGHSRNWRLLRKCSGDAIMRLFLSYFRQAYVHRLKSTYIYRNLHAIKRIFRWLLKNWEKRLLASLCLSILPLGTIRLPLDGFLWNLIFVYFFRDSVGKIQVSLTSDKNSRNFTSRPMYMSDKTTLSFLGMRNVSVKSCREDQNTRFTSTNFFLKCAVYEIMWGNIVEPDRPRITIWLMHMARWIPKSRNTDSENWYILLFHCNNSLIFRSYVHCLSLRFVGPCIIVTAEE